MNMLTFTCCVMQPNNCEWTVNTTQGTQKLVLHDVFQRNAMHRVYASENMLWRLNNLQYWFYLGFFLMSSNWPTTWETLVRIILNAMSSSPIISNLEGKVKWLFVMKPWQNQTSEQIIGAWVIGLTLPVFILILVSFPYQISYRFTISYQLLGHRRL